MAPAEAAPALAKFTGAGRRFEPHGRTERGAEVYDDYAHHPTEVRATLEAARTLEPRRLVAAFQPHLYSRTKMLAREFGESLALADLIVVLDIYRAREHPGDFPGVSGYLVAEAAADAADGRPVWWLPDARPCRGAAARRAERGGRADHPRRRQRRRAGEEAHGMRPPRRTWRRTTRSPGSPRSGRGARRLLRPRRLGCLARRDPGLGGRRGHRGRSGRAPARTCS